MGILHSNLRVIESGQQRMVKTFSSSPLSIPTIKREKFNNKKIDRKFQKRQGVPLGFLFNFFGPNSFVGSLCFDDWI